MYWFLTAILVTGILRKLESTVIFHLPGTLLALGAKNLAGTLLHVLALDLLLLTLENCCALVRLFLLAEYCNISYFLLSSNFFLPNLEKA